MSVMLTIVVRCSLPTARCPSSPLGAHCWLLVAGCRLQVPRPSWRIESGFQRLGSWLNFWASDAGLFAARCSLLPVRCSRFLASSDAEAQRWRFSGAQDCAGVAGVQPARARSEKPAACLQPERSFPRSVCLTNGMAMAWSECRPADKSQYPALALTCAPESSFVCKPAPRGRTAFGFRTAPALCLVFSNVISMIFLPPSSRMRQLGLTSIAARRQREAGIRKGTTPEKSGADSQQLAVHASGQRGSRGGSLTLRAQFFDDLL